MRTDVSRYKQQSPAAFLPNNTVLINKSQGRTLAQKAANQSSNLGRAKI